MNSLLDCVKEDFLSGDLQIITKEILFHRKYKQKKYIRTVYFLYNLKTNEKTKTGKKYIKQLLELQKST